MDAPKIYILAVDGISLGIIATLGIVGNLMTVWILAKPQMKSSMNYLLIGLTSSDMLTVLVMIVAYLIPSFEEQTGYLHELAQYLNKQSSVGNRFRVAYHTTRTMSIYLTLVISLERYIAVCHPLKARSMCTCRRALVAMLLVLIVAVSANLVFHLKENDRSFLVVGHYISFSFLLFCPAAALVWFNGCIYWQIRKANKRRETLSSNQKKEINLAAMLLCIVIVFLICNSLRTVWIFTNHLNREKYNIFAATDRLAVSVYTSANFIIYSIFGKKFRNLFFRMFVPCCSKEPNSNNTPQTTETSSTKRSILSLISVKGSVANTNEVQIKP